MAAINNKDILNSLVELFEMLDKKIKQTNDSMEQLEKTIKQTNNSGSGADAKKIIENTEKLNEQTRILNETEKEKIKLANQIITIKAKQNALEDDNVKRLEIEKQLLAAKNKAVKDEVQNILGLNDAYKQLVKQTNAAQANYKKMAASLGVGSDEAKAAKVEFDKLNDQLKEINQNSDDNRRSVGDYTMVLRKMRLELRETKGILLSFPEGSKEYNEALKKSAAITDDLADMQERVRGTAMDLEGIMGNVSKVTSGVANGFQAIQGAQALMGVESEDLQKSLVKVQAAMAIAQGVEGLEGMYKNTKNLITQLKLTAVGQKVVTAAQWLWNAAMAANPIGLIVAGIVALGGAIYGLTKAFQSNEEALIKERTALDGVVLGSKEAVEAHNDHIEEMRKLDLQLSVTKGNITQFEYSIIDLAASYNESIETINKTTETKLEKVNGFWNGLWNSIKGGGVIGGLALTAEDAANVLIDQAQAVSDEQEKLNKRVEIEAERNRRKEIEDNRAKNDELKKQALERAQYEFELNRRLNLAMNNDDIASVESLNATKTLTDKAYEQSKLDESARFKAMNKDLLDYNAQLRQDDLKDAQERSNELKEIYKENTEYALEQLGFMAASGKASAKEYAKFMITLVLDTIERTILLNIATIWAKQLAEKGFLGIPLATALTAIVKGVFNGAKARVSNFAEGTEYVNGPGTETSDSIPANLSRGERVIPASINKQLNGIANKSLPAIIASGLNTHRMESILDEMRYYNKMSSLYLSNGSNTYVHDGFLIIRDWKSGEIVKMPIRS